MIFKLSILKSVLELLVEQLVGQNLVNYLQDKARVFW